MALTPRFSNFFSKLTNTFKSNFRVVKLWDQRSTASKEKKNVSLHNDTCNCDTNVSNIRFKTNNTPHTSIPFTPNSEIENIPVLPVDYALEMPPKSK